MAQGRGRKYRNELMASHDPSVSLQRVNQSIHNDFNSQENRLQNKPEGSLDAP